MFFFRLLNKFSGDIDSATDNTEDDISEDNIIYDIFPPKVWEEDGVVWRQSVMTRTPVRTDVTRTRDVPALAIVPLQSKDPKVRLGYSHIHRPPLVSKSQTGLGTFITSFGITLTGKPNAFGPFGDLSLWVTLMEMSRIQTLPKGNLILTNSDFWPGAKR